MPTPEFQRGVPHPPEVWVGRLDHFIDLIRAGRMPMKAAREARIDWAWLTDRRREDPDLNQQIIDAINEYAEVVEQVILDAALARPPEYDAEAKVWVHVGPSKDSVTAAEKWLKARARWLWNPDPKMTVEHQHKVELTTSADVAQLVARLEQRKARAAVAWRPEQLPAGTNDEEPVDAEVIEHDA